MRRIQLTWRTLLISAVVSAVLFIAAGALYGSGKPKHSTRVDVSNVIWGLFLISMVVLLLLIIVVVARWVLSRRAAAR
jgi:predicted membrane channel-forming protein YqfA (hemolysin III family)